MLDEIGFQLNSQGGSCDDREICAFWAMGFDWASVRMMDIPSIFRDKHPNLEIIHDLDSVEYGAKIIVKEYLNDKNRRS